MTDTLRKYFPDIRSRNEVMADIQQKKELLHQFQSWTKEQQDEFLDFCCGARGVKILYDSFFKEIMNPENTPERLNGLLSLLLGRSVKILHVLPNDSSRIADESSLLVMDILVELEDKSLANVEVQKIGYAFPGPRCACYSADLLLRQYKRIRGEKGKKFSYRDIKSVYTIIFYEKSLPEFRCYPDTYLHFFEQSSNTGLHMELLQKYLFIPLDIFSKNMHNIGIQTELEAWLAFLSSDDPADIIAVITRFPEFKPLYDDIYTLCRNTEKVMGMFSKELLELDRNTVQYMIDEMQEEIDRAKEEIDRAKEEMIQKDEQLFQKENQLIQKNEQLEESNRLYRDALKRIEELEKKLS